MIEENEDEENIETKEDNKTSKIKQYLTKKNIIIFSIATSIIIIMIICYFIFSSGNKNNIIDNTDLHNQEHNNSNKQATKQEIIYYNLPDFLVNLNAIGNQASFLKFAASLEMSNLDVPKLEAKMPLIKDTFQVYLRELRNEDLQGSAGIFRLRQELLMRINKIMYPIKIHDILFREILVQ
jgi:flagellar protein FliL